MDGGPPSLRVDAGWPLRSLRGWGPGTQTARRNILGTAVLVPQVGERAIAVSRTVRNTSVVRLLPLSPIAPGFAINTVFYAFFLWLLIAVPFALRRRRRIKLGLCPKCAYPVGTNEVCTECGAAVVRHLQSSG